MTLKPAQTGRITAVLGPTNTGKTYLALERMLTYSTGMMGFPLRLLARENYDRLVRLKGRHMVALITGEERILPAAPAYFICTVEAMPVDRAVDFIAIDEVQLAADPDRGHHFTDRILNARGRMETMFVGAETIRPLLQLLVPGIEIETRPRFSTLTYSGYKKLTKLTPRSVVVAFTANEVYQLAEVMRQRMGGAAVVLGALSPRTRNAQVALYQSGEVNYLVATDAIGMGLNMNVEHVAFSRLSKYDGRVMRLLRADEVAQIAGRSGRHTTDGTFGGTGEVSEFPPDLVEAVESHKFPALASLMWRNSDLDFRSAERLLRTLEVKPPFEVLRRPREAEDVRALQTLLHNSEIAGRLRGPVEVLLLWEVCQVPDFEKILSETYLQLLTQLFLHLSTRGGVLPPDWVAAQVGRLDKTDGDIDVLTARLAQIRTWTYITNRDGWLKGAWEWQERTRAVEDRLSDALHEKLTERFVERRPGIGMRGKAAGAYATVEADHTVLVDGARVGWFNGFTFVPDTAHTNADAKEVLRTIRSALCHAASVRAGALLQAGLADLRISPAGEVVFQKAVVATLVRGSSLYQPAMRLVAGDWLEVETQRLLLAHLGALAEGWVRQHLAPLLALPSLGESSALRGLCYQLTEAMGLVVRAEVEPLIAGLTKTERGALQQAGVRLARALVYVDGLWTPETVRVRALLWALWQGGKVAPPPQGKAVPLLAGVPYAALGYWAGPGVAVRADLLDEVIASLYLKTPPTEAVLAKRLGVAEGDVAGVLKVLGYRRVGKGDLWRYVQKKTLAEVPRDASIESLKAAWEG